MRQLTLLLAAILFLPTISAASPHPVHYLKTHKEVILADLIDIGAATAISYTSSMCIRDMRIAEYPKPVLTSGCSKQGWEDEKVQMPVLLFANHMLWHFAPDSGARHAIWMLTVPYAASVTVHTYWNIADGNVPYLRARYGQP